MDGVGAAAIWSLVDTLSKDRPERTRETDAVVVSRDGDGTTWVRFAGTESATPVVSSAASVRIGQSVRVRVEDGRARIVANTSEPSVGGVYVQTAIEPVDKKAETAARAADLAKTAADSAQTSADTAATAAASAQTSADAAQTAADAAQADATAAGTAAATAQTSADQAIADAATAQGAAESALVNAASAQTSADEAQASAVQANRSANGALAGLSTVQDVVGTLEWAAEHTTYALTEDAEVTGGKTYYVRTGTGTEDDPYAYERVEEPVTEDISTYYEATSDAMQDYITSHLALTDDGLWVSLSDSGYRVLVAADAVRIYDATGALVSTFGQSVFFSADRPQRVGGADAYVEWNGSDLNIVGANISITATETLEDRLASVGSDAVAAANAYTESNVEALNEAIATTNDSVDAASQRIDDTNDRIDEFEDSVNTYFGFGGDGLTIGKQKSPFSVLLTEERLSFREARSYYALTEDTEVVDGKAYYARSGSGTDADPYTYARVATPTAEGLPTYYELFVDETEQQELAYASGNAFHAPVMAVDDELQMGDWAWVPRSNGNLALKWVGGE